MATVVVLTTTRRGLGPDRPGDDKEGRPSTTRALVGALLGHEDDVGGSAATSTRDGWEDAGTPSWRDALVSARAALDASGARDTTVTLASTRDLPLDGRVAVTHPVCAEHGTRRALFVGDGTDARWARDALTTGLDPNTRFDPNDGTRVIADDDATREALVDAMRWLARDTRSGDSALMHVSGCASPKITREDVREYLVRGMPRCAWLVLVLDVVDDVSPSMPYVATLGPGEDARRCAMRRDPRDSIADVNDAAARLAASLGTFGGDDGGVVGPVDVTPRVGGGGKRRGKRDASKDGDPACCAVS